MASHGTSRVGLERSRTCATDQISNPPPSTAFDDVKEASKPVGTKASPYPRLKADDIRPLIESVKPISADMGMIAIEISTRSRVQTAAIAQQSASVGIDDWRIWKVSLPLSSGLRDVSARMRTSVVSASRNGVGTLQCMAGVRLRVGPLLEDVSPPASTKLDTMWKTRISFQAGTYVYGPSALPIFVLEVLEYRTVRHDHFHMVGFQGRAEV